MQASRDTIMLKPGSMKVLIAMAELSSVALETRESEVEKHED